ncbi:MAG: DUF3488 and transglutaminase-like domain-containing protein [Actinomycetota bacterium]|nr:DUF3488 and transglutaminase-like domain-containing protein [Actinomycetota bacterium]
MPIGYSLFTGILAITGQLGLIMTGDITPVLYPMVPVAIYGYYRLARGKAMAPKWAIGAGAVLTMLLFGADVAIAGTDILLAVAHLTIIFQALKSFDLKDPWDNLQVFFMSLLQVLVTSELTRSIAFGVVFVIFVAAMAGAITISHFIKEGTSARVSLPGPVTFVSTTIIAMTVVCFVIIPRPRGGYIGGEHESNTPHVGFSGNVRLGALEGMELDPTIVMRVESPAPPPYYLRGAVLDRFDGTAWSSSVFDKYPLPGGVPDNISGNGNSVYDVPRFNDSTPANRKTWYRISLEPSNSQIAFAPAGAVSLKTSFGPVLADEEGIFTMPEKAGRRISYTVFVSPAAGPGNVVAGRHVPPVNSEDFLQMPRGLERLQELAMQITNGYPGPLQKAYAIEKYLGQHCSYSLYVPASRPGISPIIDFLFGTRRGYCEHFASAMALMLRAAGIPSRLVAGYSGGEFNPVGNYSIIRQRDAHTWVEALINGKWTRFDPTPAGLAAAQEKPGRLSLYIDALRMKWFRYVVSFSSSDQARLLGALTSGFTGSRPAQHSRIQALARFHLKASPAILPVTIILGAALAVIAAIRAGKAKDHSPQTRMYLKFRKRLGKMGAQFTASSTPDEVLKEAAVLGFPDAARNFINEYEEIRFGKKPESALFKRNYRELMSFQPNSPRSGTKVQ